MTTALLGSVFIGGQIYEFSTFVHEGMKLDTSTFSSAFFVLTGFHGAHVTVGILMLLSLVMMSYFGRLSPGGERVYIIDVSLLSFHALSQKVPLPLARGPSGPATWDDDTGSGPQLYVGGSFSHIGGKAIRILCRDFSMVLPDEEA